MKKITFALLTAAVIFTLVISSCSKPTPVGADILEQDQSDIAFTDTLSLIMSSVTEDSVLVYSSDVTRQLGVYLCGNLEDPIFGNTNASIYTQFSFGSVAPDFSDSTIKLDSVVLLLEYDTTGFYGDTALTQNIEIFTLDETIDSMDTYFSNTTFATNAQPIGALYNFIPRPKDNVTLIDVTGDTTATLDPHLRIKLDDSFGNQLLDTSNYTTEENFINAFKGLHIRSTTDSKTMMGFRLLGPVSSISRVSVFYTEDDTTNLVFNYFIEELDVKLTNLDHDYTNSDIPQFLNNSQMGDSLLFIQGGSGPNIRMEVPNSDQLGSIIVNKAELEFTIATLMNDDGEIFTPARNIIVSEEDADGDLILIEDVLLNFNAFGGRVIEEDDGNGNTVMKYKMNISSHFQQYVNGDTTEPLFLRIFGKQETAARAVLYGPGHSQFPAKLNLAYTILN